MARGSLYETESHLLLSQRIGFLSEEDVNRLLDISSETGRILAGLRAALEAKLES